jgi:hypothetical protein
MTLTWAHCDSGLLPVNEPLVTVLGTHGGADRWRPYGQVDASHTSDRNANWPDWHAAYMVAEQDGRRLPA